MGNIGIGVDIEKIERFNDCFDDVSFLHQIFTQREIDAYFLRKNKIPHLAGRFCAKEAVIKAFGDCKKKIFFKDVEIFNNDNGSPYAVVNKHKDYDTKISISHDESHAIAISLIKIRKT